MITSAEQLKNTKIKVSTPEISEKVQKKLFEFGYKRIDGIDTVFYTEREYIFIYNHVFSNVIKEQDYNTSTFKEIFPHDLGIAVKEGRWCINNDDTDSLKKHLPLPDVEKTLLELEHNGLYYNFIGDTLQSWGEKEKEYPEITIEQLKEWYPEKETEQDGWCVDVREFNETELKCFKEWYEEKHGGHVYYFRYAGIDKDHSWWCDNIPFGKQLAKATALQMIGFIDFLAKEAKKRYPEGTKVRFPNAPETIATITEKSFDNVKKHSTNDYLLAWTKELRISVYHIYHYGKWAEAVSLETTNTNRLQYDPNTQFAPSDKTLDFLAYQLIEAKEKEKTSKLEREFIEKLIKKHREAK